MFGLGFPEIILILVIVVLIFGTSRIPELGRGLGEGIRNFKKSVRGEDEKNLRWSKKPMDGRRDPVASHAFAGCRRWPSAPPPLAPRARPLLRRPARPPPYRKTGPR